MSSGSIKSVSLCSSPFFKSGIYTNLSYIFKCLKILSFLKACSPKSPLGFLLGTVRSSTSDSYSDAESPPASVRRTFLISCYCSKDWFSIFIYEIVSILSEFEGADFSELNVSATTSKGISTLISLFFKTFWINSFVSFCSF